MKIIKPSTELVKGTGLEFIERCARTCYKSEEKITDGSARKFVENIMKRGHLSVIEHERLILKVDSEDWFFISQEIHYDDLVHFRLTTTKNGNIMSGNMRAFRELLEKHEKYEFLDQLYVYLNKLCPIVFTIDNIDTTHVKGEGYNLVNPRELSIAEQKIHDKITVRVICNRGVSHELVRHRKKSFSQESTRYVSYGSKDMQFIEPCFWQDKKHVNIYTEKGMSYIERNLIGDECLTSDDKKLLVWGKILKACEEAYNELLELGAKPQEARDILPNALKTEIVITGTIEEWFHFFSLRCDKAAHPQAQEIAYDLLKQMTEYLPDVFKEFTYMIEGGKKV